MVRQKSRFKSADSAQSLHRYQPRLEALEDRTMLDAAALLAPDDFMINMMEQATRNLLAGGITKTKLGVTTTTPIPGTYLGQWLVGLSSSAQVNTVAGNMNATLLSEAGLLEQAFIYHFSGSTPQSAYAELNAERAIGNVTWFFPLLSVDLQTEFIPNDPLFNQQWHLNNTGQSGGVIGQDARLPEAWDFNLGGSATIAIVDNGVQYNHPDLAANLWTNPGEIPGNGIDDDGNGLIDDVNGWDFVSNDNDPINNGNTDIHGTAVAGIAAARGNNGIGVTGAAPNARFVPIRLLTGEAPAMPTDLAISRALTYKPQNIDIYNNSWGQTGNASYQVTGPLTLAAYQSTAQTGRGGLGGVIVRSAGNNTTATVVNDINRNMLRNSRFVTTVGSVNDSGIRSTNSNYGAPLIVMAPSSRGTALVPNDTGSVTTTDLTGANGHNGIVIDTDYTNRFGSTSASAALVSGVVALMLTENPTLTYRDVQQILARTARRTDVANVDWVQNGAGFWVNHQYGFGVVDAAAAVNLARVWTSLGSEVSVTSGTITTNLPIPDANPTGITVNATLPNTIPNVEWVEVEVNIPNHTWRGDLNFQLTGPSGTISNLSLQNINDSAAGLVHTFTTYRHLGESSGGNWALRIWDGFAGDTGTLVSWKINVHGASQVPIIGVSDNYTIFEDNQLVVSAPGVLTNDINVTSATLLTTTTHGTLNFNTNGSFIYTPQANYNNSISGPDSFTYRAINGAFQGNIVTVTINITPVNDAPVANPDGFPDPLYIVKPGSTLVVPSRGVLANDTDIDNDPLTLTAQLVSSTLNGNLNLNTNGGFSYAAFPGTTGIDSFVYRAYDGTDYSNSVTVNLLINSQPVSGDDHFNVAYQTQLNGNVRSNDSDPDFNLFTSTLVATTPNGNLTLNPDGTFVYIPHPGFFGIDSFTYRSDDPYYNPANPDQVGNIATVTIRVDRLPVAMPDNYSMFRNSVLEIFFPGVLINDFDLDTPLFGDVITANLVTSTTHGSLIFNENGYFRYTPNANYTGPDSFTYRAFDGLFYGLPTTVNINVLDVPIAVNDFYTTFQPTLTVNSPGVLSNDSTPNVGPLSAHLLTQPLNGNVQLNPDGSFTYSAINGYIGADSFTYRVHDGVGFSDPATVTISVFSLNQPPVAADDAYSLPSGVSFFQSAPGVLQNDSDPDGNPLTASLVVGPFNGSLFLNPDGSFSYTPLPGFQGTDSFSYRASDGLALSNVATVTLTVGTPPPPPSNPARRIIMGQATGSELKVVAGETGQVLFTLSPYGTSFTGGIRVATGDLNGDGVPDIITAPGASTGTGAAPGIRVFDGVTGNPFSGILGTGLQPFASTYRGGINVAVGDLNRDGRLDILAGADANPGTSQPWFRSYNGINGVQFAGWRGAFTPFTGGVRVASGDVNGDGRDDIIVSRGSVSPVVQVYNPAASTATAGRLRSFNAYTTMPAGGVFVAAGDLDGDGRAEIVTGTAANANGQIRIFYGNTSKPTRNLSIADTTGPARVAVGDINGDGKLDIVVGIASSNTSLNSRARVYDATTLLEMFGTDDFNYGDGFKGALFTAALAKKGPLLPPPF